MRIAKLLAILGASAFALGAQASLINSTSSDGPGKDLQSLFDGWVDGGYNVDNNYVVAPHWTMGVNRQSAASLILEITGSAGANTFGLYDIADPNTRLEVYAGGDSAGQRRTIAYDPGTHLFVTQDNTDPLFPVVLGHEVFSSANFGFYLENATGTYYSNPALNGDLVQMVAFQGTGQDADFLGDGSAPWLTNEWVLAWEDFLYSSSDQDYNDMVLVIESITPVPEPSALAMMGLGLLGLVAIRRKRA